MTIVDRDGRLFGRLNLLDAILMVLAFGLVPLGYGAYVLFRTPTPRLMAVEPVFNVQPFCQPPVADVRTISAFRLSASLRA